MAAGECDCHPVPELHIIAQFCEHGEARIVGNRAGLRMLRDTISAALDNLNAEPHESDDVFCADGEGYHIIVERRDGLDGVPLPYARPV